MTDKWWEGYTACRMGIVFNPYSHWEGYPEHEQSCKDWELGWEAAQNDTENE